MCWVGGVGGDRDVYHADGYTTLAAALPPAHIPEPVAQVGTASTRVGWGRRRYSTSRAFQSSTFVRADHARDAWLLRIKFIYLNKRSS